jgi:hypothetical protein
MWSVTLWLTAPRGLLARVVRGRVRSGPEVQLIFAGGCSLWIMYLRTDLLPERDRILLRALFLKYVRNASLSITCWKSRRVSLPLI